MSRHPQNLLENTWLILVPIALCFVAYSFMLSAPFKTLDDEYTIEKGQMIKDFANLPTVFRTSYFSGDAYYRPLIIFSYMIEYHFFGLNPFFYNLTNVLVHSLTVLVLFSLMRLLLADKPLALLIAGLFAIHPVHWEAVSNIAGRSILLCALFVVTAFWMYVRWRSGGQKKYLAFSLGCFILALLSKESAGMLPLLIIGYEWFFPEGNRRDFKKTVFRLIPFAVVAVVYVLWREHLGITKFFHWRNVPENVLGFLTFLRSVITDIRIFFWPSDLHFDRMAKLIPRFGDPQAVFVYVFFAAVFAALLIFRRRIPPIIQFFLFWFAVELLPVSQLWVSVGVQPGAISTAEHFLYVPAVGFLAAMVLAGGTFIKYYGRNISRVFLWSLGAAYALFLFLITVEQSIYASNEITMLERSLKLQPDNSRIRNSVALAYAKQRDYRLAEQHFRLAVASDPYSTRARIGLGRALYDQGRYFESMQEFEKVQYPQGYEELLLRNLKQTYAKLVEAYRQKITMDPDNARWHYSLGIILMKSGDIAQALAHYQQAVGLDPDFKEAWMNLAAAYAASGDPARAKEAYVHLLGLPGDKDLIDHYAALNLADLLRRTGEPQEAELYEQKAAAFAGQEQ